MANTQVVLRVTALLLTALGSLMIAVAVLRLHEVEMRDRSFDEKVLMYLKRTRVLSIIGICVLVASAVIAIIAEVSIF